MTPITDVKPGDRIIYRGRRRTVKAVDVLNREKGAVVLWFDGQRHGVLASARAVEVIG